MEVVEVIAPAGKPEAELDAKELVLKMLEEAEEKERICAKDICVGIKAVGMCAKDLHYRAKGEAFYGEHLLADLGWQVERLTDEFIEVYYLGDKGWNAPTMADIYSSATIWCPVVQKSQENASSEFWARRLLEVCERLIAEVEKAKGILTTKAGTQAALDDISKQTLQVVGLLKRNLK